MKTRMRMISPGTTRPIEYYIKCTKCGCEFIYGETDTFMSRELQCGVIPCMHCGELLKHSEENELKFED